MSNSWKELKNPFFTSFFLLLFLLLFFKVQGSIPFAINSVQTTKTNLFQVTGEGTETIVPDTATVSFGITKSAASVGDAQNEVNSRATTILDSLKNLGIETNDIKTVNYSVDPNYDYRTEDSQKIKGYTVTQNIQVKIKPIEKVNQAIDAVTKNGANLVGGITFGLNDAMQKDMQNKVREKAITNAKQKAERIANIAGMKLGRIVNVEESSEVIPETNRANVMAVQKADTIEQTPTDITPGENTYSQTITLSYETY